MSSTDPYRPQPGEPYGQQPGGPVPYEQLQPYGQPQPQPYGQQPGYGQGYAQAYGQPAYAQGYAAAGYQPTGYVRQPELAHWGLRLGAWIVDGIVVNLPSNLVYAALAAAMGGQGTFADSIALNGDIVWGAWWLANLVRLALWGWNRWWRMGSTGQSLGKGATRTRMVDATTGEPVGFGRALLRDVAHLFLDWLPLGLGFLWPLWDARRQTFADKVVGTVVVRD